MGMDFHFGKALDGSGCNSRLIVFNKQVLVHSTGFEQEANTVLHNSQVERDRISREFRETDAARSYRFRPPYPPEIFDFLPTLVPKHDRLLDVGCGPGKIAIPLADRFSKVVALDPSGAMIEEGKTCDASHHKNIEWLENRLEKFETEGYFDLVTAGSSIHWVALEEAFPKLAKWTDVIAVISGDEPDPPPCGPTNWKKFLTRWLGTMAAETPNVRHAYDRHALSTEAKRHETWIRLEGRMKFRFEFIQSISDFVEGQHSRATWSRAAMGSDLTRSFDNELERLMTPYSKDGFLELAIETEVAWGKPCDHRS